MRCTILMIIFVCLFAGNAFSVDASPSPVPQMFSIGHVKVWAIADGIVERDISVLAADPDIVRQYIPSGTYPSAYLCFLLQTEDNTILIDTGNGNPPDLKKPSNLMASLNHIGITPEEIDTVLLTHMHGDHIGGLVWEGKPAFPNAVVRVGRIEREFWLDDASLALFPSRKAGFEKAKKIMAMYDGRIEDFEFGEKIVPGLFALDSRGHTPGHTAFLLESNWEKLLCVGDLLHSAALQFVRPDINATFDMDTLQAKAARREFLSKAVWKNMPIAGMHLPFPGIGTVRQDGQEAFVYQPGLSQ